MNDRAKWIDGTIQDAVPKWKLDLLQKINHSLLRKFIRGDIETIKTRLVQYEERTLPLLDYFKKENFVVHRISGEGSVAEVHEAILKVIE